MLQLKKTLMDWNTLISVKRLGKPTSGKITPESRTEFQRDYDRLIFSSPFRRLQNKTQVFPLPGSVFVHNRLTHSLEVASVGRSLGNMVSTRIESMGVGHMLLSEIGAVVAAGCLAHDLGNPPFGHSGEDAIKDFFKTGSGSSYKSEISNAQWCDMINFDGNANTFRVLSHQFNGHRQGGYALTYSMLASIVKYPYESVLSSKAKFGFFQSEKQTFSEIAKTLGLVSKNNDDIHFSRHPLVFLVEAADDICYQIMDIEDACKLGILSYNQTKELYMGFFGLTGDDKALQGIEKTMNQVSDRNEQIAYLRASVINRLVQECVQVFIENYHSIMDGCFESSLIKNISPGALQALHQVIDVSVDRVYSHSSVVEIELAGYKIISTLIEHFIEALSNNKHSKYNSKLMKLFPGQFLPQNDNTYSKIQSVVDFVSGMTDVYALELYRKITGISLPGIG